MNIIKILLKKSIKKNIEGGFFCSQDCFKAAWAEHKKKHNGK